MNSKTLKWMMPCLSVGVVVISVVMALLGKASWLEAASFVTGAFCVWLTVKENIWNFPLGLINVATFCFVFYEAGLYADSGLQVVYFLLGCIGWYTWLYGGVGRTELKVNRASRKELWLVGIFVVISTVLLWNLLSKFGGSASFWDALTTSMSLAAQWLLNRKHLESWVYWITVDVIYIPLYLSKNLYLTSLLYAVFLVMATMGLLAWHKTWKRSQ